MRNAIVNAFSTPTAPAQSDWPLCPKCGHANEPSEWMCRKCGQTLSPMTPWPPPTDSWVRTPTAPAGPTGWQGTSVPPRPVPGRDPYSLVVRSYHGTQAQAGFLMQNDALLMAQHGYRVVAQSYAPGQYGAAAFLIALVLCLFLVGILIFAYLLIVKPAGTLTVTYQR